MNSTYNSTDFSFNQGFWLLLKKSIMLHKDSTSLKEKILVAKRILTPIIQDLMTDALVQTEIEKLSKFEKNRKIDGKNIKILFNKVKSDEAGCFEGSQSDNEWATKILMEINRDLEEPFEKVLVEKHRRPLEEPVNETLLEKLISVYQHLGEIIEHLKNRYSIKSEQVYLHASKNRDVKLFTSDLQVSSEKATENIADSIDTNAELENPKCKCKELDSNIFDDTIKHQVINYQCSYKDLYVLDFHHKTCEEKNICETIRRTNSVICLRQSEEPDELCTTSDHKSVANSFSERPSVERDLTHVGKKEIVKKCLEGLDKVKTYLESLRIEDDCEEVQLPSEDKCKQEDCHESPRECMILKQQVETERNHNTFNYRTIDVSSVRPDTDKKGYDTHKLEAQISSENSPQIHPFAESRIPKLIHKKRGDTTGKRSCSDMKVILRNGLDCQQKITNLLIFNPDDPCKSIIKMKDHENLAVANSNAGVSKIMKSPEMTIRIFLYGKRDGVKKESTRSPLWPRPQNLESTKFHLYHGRLDLILLVEILCSSKLHKIQRVFKVTASTKYFIILLKVSGPIKEYEGYLTIAPICSKYETYFNKEEFQTSIFLKITLVIYHRRLLEAYNIYDNPGSLLPVSEFSKLLRGNQQFHFRKFNLSYLSEEQLVQYMKNLFRFTSFLKGDLTADKYQYHQGNKKIFFETKSKRMTDEFPKIDYNFQMNSRNENYHTYFFSYSVRSGGEEQLYSSDELDDGCDSLSTYPIWRIKKSKYYDLPNKKSGVSSTEPKLTEDSKLESKLSPEKIQPVNKSNTELPTIRCTEESLEQKLSDNHNLSRKSEVKRKVSFRDDVDFDRRGKYNKEAFEYGLNNAKSKESISSDSLDVLKNDDELADLLMRDSLTMISSSSLPERCLTPSQSEKKENWRHLELTNSAEDILTKLSRSFDYRGEERYPILEIENRRPISKIPRYKRSLLSQDRPRHKNKDAEIRNENMKRSNSQLLDLEGFMDSNARRKEAKLIAEEFISKRNFIENIKSIDKNIKDVDIDEFISYYDSKARPIEDIYDEYGNRMEMLDRYLSSPIFDIDGNLRTDLYTKTGEKINAIYNSNGELLKTLSRPKMNFELPKTDKIKNIPLISELFEEADAELGDERNKKKADDSLCSKNFSDFDGSRFLDEGYDERTKTPKIIAPKEHENEKKEYTRNLDSKVPEMTAVFEGPESRKSEVSISWLNELLTASKVFARKKRDSIFRKKPKLRPVDLKVLYDAEDNIITRVYDCEGGLLAESPSGNAERLIPFLFDHSGTFIDSRFLPGKRELKFVFDRNKNMVKSISLTILNELLNRHSENPEEHISESRTVNENVAYHQKLSETSDAAFERIKPQQKVVKQGKYIRQLFDEKGNPLNTIYDENGQQLEIGNPEFASNLTPYLFDSEEQRSNQYYDAAGRKLRAIYDENGNIVKNMIISLTHLNREQRVNKPSTHDNLFTKIKNYSELVDIIISLDEDCYNKTENTSEKTRSENNFNRNRKKIPEHNKLKLERNKSKLPHKIPTRSEHSVSRLRASTNNSVDKYLKSSTSVNSKSDRNDTMKPPQQSQKSGKSFYDVNGHEITEVYKGRDMMKVKSGEADKLAPFIFDKNGFLRKNIVDKYGRDITKIYDYKGREIRRTTVKSISSEHIMRKIKQTEKKRRQLDIYDRNGNLVTEICDRSGRQLVLTKSLQMEQLSPFIFHENGNRRRVYDKNGHDIGPLYDHKGNLLKYSPIVKEVRKKETQHFDIFSKSGRKLNNFYDSEGTIIISLYDDDARLICSIEEGQNNANILSKYLFDEYGRFLKGKYLDFRGSRIKRVYDSKDNIVHWIVKSFQHNLLPGQHSNHSKDSKRSALNHYSASKINKEPVHNYKYRQRVVSGRIGNDSLMNATSQSDVELEMNRSKLKRPISAYFLKEPLKEYDTPVRQSCSSSSVLMKTKTFDVENERVMIENCKSKNDLLRHFSSDEVFEEEKSFSGPQRVKDKPLVVFDESSEKPKTITTKKKTKLTFYDINEHTKSINGAHDKKIAERSHKHRAKSNNPPNDGSLIEKSNASEGRNITKERNSIDYFDSKSKKERERSRHAKIHHRKRLPFFINLRDKFLTAIFENLNPYYKHTNVHSKNIETQQEASVIFEKLTKKDGNIEEIVSKSGFHEVACKTKNKINFQLHKRRKIKNCDNTERKICDIRARCCFIGTSGDLGPTSCTTCRSISTIYTNKKLLKRKHDHQKPAKVDSDLIYVVSKQSLPAELNKQINPVFTQMNYTIEGTNYYTLDDFSARAYSKRRTSECICQQCQSTGKNKNLMGKFGDEFMSRLSKLTVPFDKLLTKNVSCKEQKDGTDSLEALINSALKKKMDQNIGFPEQKSCSSSCVALQLDDTIPVSRKIIQETLLACVHLNNSSEVIGKLSNMMLRHFTASIMREIKKTFFKKLNALQYRKATSDDSSIFEPETVKEDICVGTELKFEDSQIVKHNIIQTETKGVSSDCLHQKNKAVSVKTAPGYLEELPSKCPRTHKKTFVCKLPNTQPFSFTMKTCSKSKLFIEKDNSKELMMTISEKNLLQDLFEADV